jgi:integrase/recombinase XerD
VRRGLAANPQLHTSVAAIFKSELDEYLAHLAIERGLSANTLAAYRRDLTRYCEYLTAQGVGNIYAVTAGQVSDFVATVREGSDGGTPLAASSVARMLASLKGWHRFFASELAFPPTASPAPTIAGQQTAILNPTANPDPTIGVTAPKLPLRLPHAISVESVQKLLDAASVGDPPISTRNRALLELLYSTGARVSEITEMDTDAVRWEKDMSLAMIPVVGKGNKQRLVPVGGFARKAVDDYLVQARPALLAKGQGTHALLLNSRGKRLSRQTVWEIIQTTAHRAKLTEHITPHTLRHSFATHLLTGGADVRVVQELLGHASVTTTQIYTLVTRDQLREVYLTSHPRAL